ncbi:hypothetical protein BKA63DRAFT_265811 [Paraphoma chrysanthemicola]|nr:hypothetical protein BKA63DRAFT_265811 [Paraphoma chrysanthemicola]
MAALSSWLIDLSKQAVSTGSNGGLLPLLRHRILRGKSRCGAWCKVANQEADLATRQEKCIRLLAPETNPGWRYRNKTIMHIALENGLRLTKVMAVELNLRKDKQRKERYMYRTKDGIQYSLDEYVRKLMKDVSNEEKKALIQCLQRNKIQRRYFRLVVPGAGEQPPGYRGLPEGYARVWEEYEAELIRRSLAVSWESAPFD